MRYCKICGSLLHPAGVCLSCLMGKAYCGDEVTVRMQQLEFENAILRDRVAELEHLPVPSKSEQPQEWRNDGAGDEEC